MWSFLKRRCTNVKFVSACQRCFVRLICSSPAHTENFMAYLDSKLKRFGINTPSLLEVHMSAELKEEIMMDLFTCTI